MNVKRDGSMHVINDFKAYYRDFSQCNIEGINDIYCSGIHFSDPIHEVHGIQDLKTYFSSMCGDLKECRFEFLGETIDDSSAWFKWNMHYRHPKLKNGELLVLNGATYIKFEPVEKESLGESKAGVSDIAKTYRITSHEDFYDMGAMLYEHTPVLGSCVRWLRNKLSKAA